MIKRLFFDRGEFVRGYCVDCGIWSALDPASGRCLGCTIDRFPEEVKRRFGKEPRENLDLWG